MNVLRSYDNLLEQIIFFPEFKKKMEILFWICFESDPRGQKFSENYTVNTELRFLCILMPLPWIYMSCHLNSPEGLHFKWKYLPCPNIQIFKKQISSETVILTPFQKLQMTAYLDDLEK